MSSLEWATLFTLGRGISDICSLKFTSGATPLLVYMASILASHFPHMCVSAEAGNSNLKITFIFEKYLVLQNLTVENRVSFYHFQILLFPTFKGN